MTHSRYLSWLAATVLTLVGVAAVGADDGKAPPAGKPDPKGPPGVRVLKDLEYAKPDGVAVHLDLYLPEKPASAALPSIVWVHGGGWIAGTKEPCPTVGFVALGYATASIEYRLSGVAPFPAQIEDVKASIRWLRSHAKEYGLDPARIGAAGASAGGHLVALLGTSQGVKAIEGEALGNATESSAVLAVCDHCGPTDLLQFDGHGSVIVASAKGSIIETFLGGPLAEKRDLAFAANPVTYVTKDDPPFLIVHGDKDDVVPVEQSRLLHAALEKAGVTSTLWVVKGGGHGASNPETNRAIVTFFEKHVKNAKAKGPAVPAAGPTPTTEGK